MAKSNRENSLKIWDAKKIPADCHPEFYNYTSGRVPVYPTMFTEADESDGRDSPYLRFDDGYLYFDLSSYEKYQNPFDEMSSWLEEDIVEYYVDDVIEKMQANGFATDIFDEESERDSLKELVLEKIGKQMDQDITEMEVRLKNRIRELYPDVGKNFTFNYQNGQVVDASHNPILMDESD